LTKHARDCVGSPKVGEGQEHTIEKCLRKSVHAWV